MPQDLEKFLEELARVQKRGEGALSAANKQSIRNAVASSIGAGQTAAGITDLPGKEGVLGADRRYWWSHPLFGLRPLALGLAVLVIVAGGIGTSFAAERSLPGDALYPIKIKINEKIRGMLAASTQAKAKWQEEVLVRRLNEADTLHAEGRLNVDRKQSLQKDIEDSSRQLDHYVTTLSAEGDNKTAAAVAEEASSTIQTHVPVISILEQTNERPDNEQKNKDQKPSDEPAPASLLQQLQVTSGLSERLRQEQDKQTRPGDHNQEDQNQENDNQDSSQKSDRQNLIINP